MNYLHKMFKFQSYIRKVSITLSSANKMADSAIDNLVWATKIQNPFAVLHGVFIDLLTAVSLVSRDYVFYFFFLGRVSLPP